MISSAQALLGPLRTARGYVLVRVFDRALATPDFASHEADLGSPLRQAYFDVEFLAYGHAALAQRVVVGLP